MALLKLNLETRPISSAGAVSPSSQWAGPCFDYAHSRQRFVPARGLLYSVVLHGLALLTMPLWPVSHSSARPDPSETWEVVTIPRDALYLPVLGGGTSGGKPGNASQRAESGRGSTAARRSSGITYPGNQVIVSDPPNPTNHIQTILQNGLVNPRVLKSLVPLPNIVKPAQPEPLPLNRRSQPALQPLQLAESSVPARVQAEVNLPVLTSPPPASLETPKLTLPVQLPAANLRPSRPPPPRSAVVAKATPAPQLLPSSATKNDRALLVLSPMPAPQFREPVIPRGEARGQFAVAVLPNLATTRLDPGSAPELSQSASAGIGASSNPEAHDAAGKTGPAGHGLSAGSTALSSGTGAQPGGASGGHEGGAAGSGPADGAKAGTGAGTGLEIVGGIGTGTGPGAGPGHGAFAGITIQGGEWPAGEPADLRPHQTAVGNQQGSFGLTVVSTGNSGGGLGDFGVFYDEPVFTVYVDMAASPGDVAASWTMEYAALHRGDVSADLAPPFPLKKETPDWPTELASRYLRQVVVAFVVIDAQGNVLEVKSMQSPNIGFVGPLLSALAKWQFRPALAGGKPVAVKALIGAPIVAGHPTG